MEPVYIDEKKCIGCGLCVNDCPAGHLVLENKRAKAAGRMCLECGHCYAICPENAVELKYSDCAHEPVVSMTEIDSDRLLSAMRSRRTMRSFTSRQVERELTEKILEAGRYSPTAANAQDVAYTVLGTRQAEAEAICAGLFRKGKKLAAPFAPALKNIHITDDFFFKGAPLVIVVSAKSSVNAALASSYMELMAESLGLGVLYSGFFVACTKLSGKLRKLLCLPKGHKVATCMVIGWPAVKYQRIPPRKELKVKEL